MAIKSVQIVRAEEPHGLLKALELWFAYIALAYIEALDLNTPKLNLLSLTDGHTQSFEY
jgi:hypothetical protein